MEKRCIQILRDGIYNAFSFANGFLNGNYTRDLYSSLFFKVSVDQISLENCL